MFIKGFNMLERVRKVIGEYDKLREDLLLKIRYMQRISPISFIDILRKQKNGRTTLMILKSIT